MKSLRRTFAAFAAVCLVSAAAYAADASGTWKWSTPGRGGGAPRESTLTLTAKDGKLMGKVSTPGRDGNTTSTEIMNGTIKGDMVSFTVERQFGDNKFVMKYSGKLAGDTITGEVEIPGRDGGDATKREWVAKRAN
jgi:hypothetical protein